MQQATGRPEGRYGRSRTRPGWPLLVGVVAAVGAFLGWVLWAALGAATSGVTAEVTAFRVLSDDSIEVRVAAVDPRDGPLGCSLRALDRTREVVGVSTVVLDPRRPGGQERWVVVRTRDRAVTATVGECSPTGSGTGDD